MSLPRSFYLLCLATFALRKNLFQIIDFTTWSRNINGILKQSLLDHVYVTNLTKVENVDFDVPTFGDPLLIKIKILMRTLVHDVKNIVKRSWKNYSVAQLCRELNESVI